jgi:hypothetical protein
MQISFWMASCKVKKEENEEKILDVRKEKKNEHRYVFLLSKFSIGLFNLFQWLEKKRGF